MLISRDNKYIICNKQEKNWTFKGCCDAQIRAYSRIPRTIGYEEVHARFAVKGENTLNETDRDTCTLLNNASSSGVSFVDAFRSSVKLCTYILSLPSYLRNRNEYFLLYIPSLWFLAFWKTDDTLELVRDT